MTMDEVKIRQFVKKIKIKIPRFKVNGRRFKVKPRQSIRGQGLDLSTGGQDQVLSIQGQLKALSLQVGNTRAKIARDSPESVP